MSLLEITSKNFLHRSDSFSSLNNILEKVNFSQLKKKNAIKEEKQGPICTSLHFFFSPRLGRRENWKQETSKEDSTAVVRNSPGPAGAQGGSTGLPSFVCRPDGLHVLSGATLPPLSPSQLWSGIYSSRCCLPCCLQREAYGSICFRDFTAITWGKGQGQRTANMKNL